MGQGAEDAERRAEAEQEEMDVGDPGIPDTDEETAEVPADIADEVGQAIALREQAVAPVSAIPLPAEWNALEVMAKRLAYSRVVPEAYRGRPEDVIAAWLYGREIGVGLMTALRDIYMVDGRAAIAAHRQLGLLRAGGVRIIESEATDERAMIVAQRKDTGEIMTVEFTMEEAARVKRKGKPLIDGDNWRSYPRDMLWARCVGRLTRRLGPDLIGGLPPYVAEEIADFSGWGIEYGGGDDALTLRPQETVHPTWKAPKSWRELGERCAHLLGADEWDIWRAEILRTVYGVDRVADIKDGLDDAWRRFQAFLRDLDDWEPKHDLDLIPRKVIQAAISAAFERAEVDGPAWRLTPDEKDRPVRTSPGIPETSEEIEDAVVVEDAVVIEEAPAEPDAEAIQNRADEYRQELSDDVDRSLIAADKKRGVKRGVTYKELVSHYGKPGEVTIAQLEEISVNLRGYSLLAPELLAETTFDAFCKSAQQIAFE